MSLVCINTVGYKAVEPNHDVHLRTEDSHDSARVKRGGILTDVDDTYQHDEKWANGSLTEEEREGEP